MENSPSVMVMPPLPRPVASSSRSSRSSSPLTGYQLI
ncbi:Uncharacterised protein [Mycobacteroides abscessus subsp. abscessus]|nr:Uncharacterised protein [Mycobacteroides abscessus subsp. abscessus]